MEEPEGDLVSAEPDPEDGEAVGVAPEIGAGAEPEPGAEDGEADGVVWAVAERGAPLLGEGAEAEDEPAGAAGEVVTLGEADAGGLDCCEVR